MLTKLTIRNFKRFREIEIALGNPVAFIGPNNSGKTSAMQAIALWDAGLRRWNEKRSGRPAPERRPGVTVNRRDVVAVPVPNANLLWRGRHTRNVLRTGGEQKTENVRIDVVVEGVTAGKAWVCGLEFDYANEESFYCRPLRTGAGGSAGRMPTPGAAAAMRVAFLPPMSGLAATETRLDEGAVNVRVGEGRTAEVLRNLCFRVSTEHPERWRTVVETIEGLFGARLNEPRYVRERGEVAMDYAEDDVRLDLSSSGRGLQQTLLILAYLHANPGAVVLLDEPDAHLEILRQREIYRLLTDTASRCGSQIIAASHSEVILNEAAGKHLAIAFVGKPHPIDGGRSQVRKALAEIGFEQYVQAEQNGWVLYLEGSTDLAILQAFARRLGHRAAGGLERPFVHYVGNQPAKAKRHYFALREALPELRGVALFNRLETEAPEGGPIELLAWRRREIENYVCTAATLEAYAGAHEDSPLPLFDRGDAGRRVEAMRAAVAEIADALRTLGKGSPWGPDVKASDDFLAPLFDAYFGRLDLPNLMTKNRFHTLAEYVPATEIDPEIAEKLDVIADAAAGAACGFLP